MTSEIFYFLFFYCLPIQRAFYTYSTSQLGPATSPGVSGPVGPVAAVGAARAWTFLFPLRALWALEMLSELRCGRTLRTRASASGRSLGLMAIELPTQRTSRAALASQPWE